MLNMLTDCELEELLVGISGGAGAADCETAAAADCDCGTAAAADCGDLDFGDLLDSLDFGGPPDYGDAPDAWERGWLRGGQDLRLAGGTLLRCNADVVDDDDDESEVLYVQPTARMAAAEEPARPAWCPLVLDEHSPRAPNPPGFAGQLYPPQAAVLAAMLQMEATPRHELACDAVTLTVGARSARLAEKFSFGKTVVAIALVCASRLPAAYVQIAPIATRMGYDNDGTKSVNSVTTKRASKADPDGEWGSRLSQWSDGLPARCVPEVRVRYRRVLPLTVVAAASSVITQWVENAARFTRLRCIVIDDVRTLRDFQAEWVRDGAASLDLVLIKAGRVTANFVVAGEPRDLATDRSMLGAFSAVIEGYAVARLVVDDFDTLRLAPDDTHIAALFTWYLSATARESSYAGGPGRQRPAVDWLRKSQPAAAPVVAAARDPFLRYGLSLRCCSDFTAAFISSTRVERATYVVAGGRAGKLAANLGLPENITEMLAAGAVESAGHALGFAVKSPGELMRRVLGSRVEALAAASAAVERCKKHWAALTAARCEPSEGAVDAAEIKRALRAGDEEFATALADARAGGLGITAKTLDALPELLQRELDEAAAPLERLRTNLAGDCQCTAPPCSCGGAAFCQCCMVPFSPEETMFVLVGCCQIVLCAACTCIRDRHGNTVRLVARCPSCSTDIVADGGIAQIGVGVALTDILRPAADLAAAAVEGVTLAEGVVVPVPPPPPRYEPKVQALCDLLLGKPVTCLESRAGGHAIYGLLEGRRDEPRPAGQPPRMLVFSCYSETKRLLAAMLRAEGIPYCELAGRHEHRDAVVAEFRNRAHVMLVATPHDCAGLHLPWITHVVLFHKILDTEVEGQLAARGQRLGREFNLEIISLLYRDE